MKNLLLIICIALIFSCKDNSNVDTADKSAPEIANEISTLEGAWKLVSFLNYGEDGVADTILSSNAVYAHSNITENFTFSSNLLIKTSL